MGIHTLFDIIQAGDTPLLVTSTLKQQTPSSEILDELLLAAAKAERVKTLSLLLEHGAEPTRDLWQKSSHRMQLLVSKELARLHPVKTILGFYPEVSDPDEDQLFGWMVSLLTFC